MIFIIEVLNTRDRAEFADVNRSTDLEVSNINFDEIRQILRQAADAQAMGGGLENTTLSLDAVSFADDENGNIDNHLLIFLHFLKVEMEIFIGDGIALNFLQKRERRSSGFALELNQSGAARDRLAQFDKFRRINGQILRLRMLAIENRGDFLGFT